MLKGSIVSLVDDDTIPPVIKERRKKALMLERNSQIFMNEPVLFFCSAEF